MPEPFRNKYSFWKDFFIIGNFIVAIVLFFPQIIGTNAIVFGYGGGGEHIIINPPVSVLNANNQIQKEDPNVIKSSKKQILSFSIPRQVGETVIDESAHTIDVIMPFGTGITSLVPNITFTGASLSPNVGQAANFENVKTYTVTAEDKSTVQYFVRVMLTSRTPRTDETDWFNNDVKRSDILRDGIIDMLDLNTVFVNWGRILPTNPADVNQDRRIDIIDFNYLMVYWGEIEK